MVPLFRETSFFPRIDIEEQTQGMPWGLSLNRVQKSSKNILGCF